MPRWEENGAAAVRNPWSEAVPVAGAVQHPLCLRAKSSPQPSSKLRRVHQTSRLLTQTVVLKDPKVLVPNSKHSEGVELDWQKSVGTQLHVKYAYIVARKGVRDLSDRNSSIVCVLY